MRRIYTSTLVYCILLITVHLTAFGQQKRLYIASDDHTDYMWSANEAGYQTAFINMLDWWIAHNEATAGNAAPYRSKWNCDGTFWIDVYERNKTAAQFGKLIDQIRSGQITVPYSPIVITYGAVPAEAVLRGMYYAGDLERRYNLKFEMATAMENQTMPLGLTSLWRGAGAKYCWHGVCDCYTAMTGFTNRENEIYWYKGLDTNKVLLKWYELKQSQVNTALGGYAETRNANQAIDDISAKANTTDYPYNIAAAFGVGWDDLSTTNDDLIGAAMAKTNGSQQVIVSNEVDFFRDFEATYGTQIPEITKSFGNEWDVSCASIAEVSARMKRSLEKLRAAEAMGAIVLNYNPTFATGLNALRKEAWMALGLYWEHNIGFDGLIGFANRNTFQRQQQAKFTDYVDQLYNLAKSNLGNLITNGTSNERFFAFNPLGWIRTDYADYPYNGSTNIKIVDVGTNAEVPFQFITKGGTQHIRVLAANIPSVGYKVFEIQAGTAAVFPDAGTNTGNLLENDFFRITYNNEGVLTSIIDKQNFNKELVQLTNGKYVNDLSTANGNSGTAVVEFNGPVSITVLTTTTAAPLAHSTRITLFKNIPRIEIDNTITQNFDATNTWSYSFNINTPTIWHEETGAVIKAKLTNNFSNPGHYATQNARYDWNTLNHFACVNEPTSYGVTLSNQDCYFMRIGNSSVTSLDQNSAQLNVLAGGRISGYGIPNQGGDNLFNQRFAITTHNAYSAAQEMKRALEHQNFVVCGLVVSPANFLLPDEFSFLDISDPGTVLWSLKPSEEGIDRGIVTRVWNLEDADAAAGLTYGLPINLAKRTTHVETDMDDNPYSNRTLTAALGKNEMKTYRTKHTVIALPVKLLSFTGTKVNTGNELVWKIAEELNLKKYILERSTDGQRFSTIGTVDPLASSAYTYIDKTAATGVAYYYRLKMIDNDNSFKYSGTILIRAAKEAFDVLLYPNPAVNEIKAGLFLDKQTRCNIQLINAAGELIRAATPLFEKGYNLYTINVTTLPAGEYTVILSAGGSKTAKSFFKN